MLGFIVNIKFFQASPLALWGALDVMMIALPVAAFFARSRRVYAGLCLGFAVLNVVDIVVTVSN